MPALSIVDAERLNLTVPGNFRYAKSAATTNTDALGNTLQTLAKYVKANPTRLLDITGHYQADEQNTSTYPNVGLARAEDVKAQLLKLGVPARQLTTQAALVTDMNPDIMASTAKGDSLYGGLTFAFTGETPAAATANPAAPTSKAAGPLLKTEQALAEAQKFTSVFQPIDLYFKLGQSTYIQTSDTKQFFAEAAAYLKANKDKKLVLTGYTDNRGPDAGNLNLSRARAQTVKSGLRRAGISSNQIVATGKGEADPKVSNETLEGRKANRRVTVVVQ